MRLLLALFVLVPFALADKPSAQHTPKEGGTPRLRAPAIDAPGELVTQSPEDLLAMEKALGELNTLAPARRVGEIDVPDELFAELPPGPAPETAKETPKENP